MDPLGTLNKAGRLALKAYLARAYSFVQSHHPITSPSSGKGDPAAGALVDNIDSSTRDLLATRVSRYFNSFGTKGRGANAGKAPIWCGSNLTGLWGPGRDLVWLVALAAWLHESDAQAEAGLSFRERVKRRYLAATGHSLPVQQGTSVEEVFERIIDLLVVLSDMEDVGLSPSTSVGDLLFIDADASQDQALVARDIREFLRDTFSASGSDTMRTMPGPDTVRAISSASAGTLCSAFIDWRHSLGDAIQRPNYINALVRTRGGGGGGGGGGERTSRSLSNGSGGGGRGRPSDGARPTTRPDRSSPSSRPLAGTPPSPSPSSSAIRCYKCQGDGHVASECTNSVVCGNCFRPGHARADCTHAAVCSICRKEGHLRAACTRRAPTPATVRFNNGRSSSTGSARSSGGASTGSTGTQRSVGGTSYLRTDTQLPRRSDRLARPSGSRAPAP